MEPNSPGHSPGQEELLHVLHSNMSNPHVSQPNVLSIHETIPSTLRTTRQGSATAEPAPDERRSFGSPKLCALFLHRQSNIPGHYNEMPGLIASWRPDGSVPCLATDDTIFLNTSLGHRQRKAATSPCEIWDDLQGGEAVRLSMIMLWNPSIPNLASGSIRRSSQGVDPGNIRAGSPNTFGEMDKSRSMTPSEFMFI